jgi:DNA polymerase/3'-5' exonuclease PolX
LSKGKRIAAGDALDCVKPVLDFLGDDARIAGSLRRGKDHVRDVDLVVTGSLPTQDEVEAAGLEWSQGGPSKVRLISKGVQVDVNRAVEGGFGACLMAFTGPHTFNIKARAWAASMGLLLNEKGVYKPCPEHEVDPSGEGTDYIFVKRKGETEKRWYKRIAGETEREVCETLGLTYTSPAGRESLKCFRGEVEWETTVQSSKGGAYHVWLGKDERWNCECKGFQFRRKCRHLEPAKKEREATA